MVKFAGKRKTKRKTDYNLQHFKNSTVLVHENTGKALPSVWLP